MYESLPVNEEMWVQPLVQEGSTSLGVTKPVRHSRWACALELTRHSRWACALEPTSHNYRSLRILESARHKKSLHNEKPAHLNEE